MRIEDKLTVRQKKVLQDFLGRCSPASGVSYIFMGDDDRIGFKNDQTACHANICSHYADTAGYEYLINTSYMAHSPSKNMKGAQQIQEWVFKDSPWAKAGLWLNTDFESVIKYGFITDTRQDSALVGSACMATKMVREYSMELLLSGIFPLMLREGIHPMLALSVLASGHSRKETNSKYRFTLSYRHSQFPFLCGVNTDGAKQGTFGLTKGIRDSILRGEETLLYARKDAATFYDQGYYTRSRNVWDASHQGGSRSILVWDSSISEPTPDSGGNDYKSKGNPFRPQQSNTRNLRSFTLDGALICWPELYVMAVICTWEEFPKIIKTWFERSKPLIEERAL